ncbi:immunity 50 family protein [Enterobacter roggenkampii]|nr:immunity 50 family protein [Enterobacter roggenkampii]MEB6511228.1 immunity 50 family protein [Enterobacter roggenkampii]
MELVEFDGFTFERFSDISCRFFTRKIPSCYPKKWEESEFNTLCIVLTFGDVVELDVKGMKVGFVCSPEIISTENYSKISITDEKLNFHCQSNFLTIEGITPYLDERWD